MSNPYSAPDSDLDTLNQSKNIPWLWTIYNTLVMFGVAAQILLFATGRVQQQVIGMLQTGSPMPAEVPMEQMVAGFLVFNYLLVGLMIVIGYLLVWRVNCRNLWALYLFSAYMVLWFFLGLESFNMILDLPDYEADFLDYATNLIGLFGDVLLFVWAIWGWRQFPPGRGGADMSA